MAKQKLTVVTEVGTFTRTTARTYTHIVATDISQQVAETVAYYVTNIAKWEAAIADGTAGVGVTHQIARFKAALAECQTDGPTWGASWCGRLDLARKAAAADSRPCRIFDVATGQEVR